MESRQWWQPVRWAWQLVRVRRQAAEHRPPGTTRRATNTPGPASVGRNIRFSHAVYAKWCAGAKAATSELDNAPGGPSSKAGNEWVKGCGAYAVGDGLSAKASPESAPPAATSPPSTHPSAPSPPAPTPSSTANGSACTTVPGYYPGGEPGYWDSQQNVCLPNGAAPENPNPQNSPPAPSQSQPAPYCDPSTGICQQAPAAPPGGYPGGSQNPCNGPDASQIGDCVPGGGINGGSP
jgi:hypothetical protein